MDLKAVDELLTTTRSIRRRFDLPRPVPAAVIQECLEIAVQAPTGGDSARYHLIVVTDPVKRARLAEREHLLKEWLAEWATSRERQIAEARRRRGL